MKACVIGCGLRTPLLVHALAHQRDSALDELVLLDNDPDQRQLMEAIGSHLAQGTHLRVTAADSVERAFDGSSFLISSFRAGGMAARARDERITLDQGYAGQETTGPAGAAMAMRGVPVALEYARLAERFAPGAWIVNFTNPAGLVTQAIGCYSHMKAIGICDTPTELFFRISLALNVPMSDLRFDYVGLNHLGWVRRVLHDGRDRMPELLADDERLGALYPGPLFEAQFLRALGLLPTEYLYFYYSAAAAHRNQVLAGTTRAEELLRMNGSLLEELQSLYRQNSLAAAVRHYTRYLNRRNASYLKLESEAKSALAGDAPDWNPFEASTGYHRIAVETIQALGGGLTTKGPSEIVLNVRNEGLFQDLEADDVVEVPCSVDENGARPFHASPFPANVRGLVIAVKQFERLIIQAAVERSPGLAKLALTVNPLVGDWAKACTLVTHLAE